jgi:hypothetical protein
MEVFNWEDKSYLENNCCAGLMRMIYMINNYLPNKTSKKKLSLLSTPYN